MRCQRIGPLVGLVLSIVLKTKPVRWFNQKKPEPMPSLIFLRVTDPTNKKPEKLHENNIFSRGCDPKTMNLTLNSPLKAYYHLYYAQFMIYYESKHKIYDFMLIYFEINLIIY
jgi:hypothetical protein